MPIRKSGNYTRKQYYSAAWRNKQKRAIAKRRKNYRRKPRIGRAPRGMTPSIYKYKRMDTFTLAFNASHPNPPSGWDLFPTNDCIQKGWAFALTSVPEYTQFTSLYSQYKLNGVRLQMYPSCNTISAYRDLSNIIMWVKPSRYGYQIDNVEELVATQAIKKRLVFRDQKPLDIYMPLIQLNQIYGTAATTDYVPIKPKWVSTQEVNTLHYGLDMIFQTVSSDAITTMPMTIKIIQTLYFSCKGVKAASAE